MQKCLLHKSQVMAKNIYMMPKVAKSNLSSFSTNLLKQIFQLSMMRFNEKRKHDRFFLHFYRIFCVCFFCFEQMNILKFFVMKKRSSLLCVSNLYLFAFYINNGRETAVNRALVGSIYPG
jgi:hypothetical protein